MGTIKRNGEQYENDIILISTLILVLVFGFVLLSAFESVLVSDLKSVFSFIHELVSPLHLSETREQLVDALIFIVLAVLLISLTVIPLAVVIKEMIIKWRQLLSNPQSFWNQFILFFRDNSVIFVIVLLYAFFYRFWEKWIANCIIDPFLCHFESSLLNDIIFIIALTVCFVLILVWGKKIKQQSLIISFIAMVVWGHYRFYHGLCGMNDSPYYLHFTSLSIFKPIKYFDILFVFAVYEYVSFFKWKYINFFTPFEINFDEIRGLTRNLPIIDQDQDLLERNESASSIVKELLETNTTKSSFTCGIDAPWGSGKTSFINLMKNHLEFDDRKIIIDFNPWLYAAEKDLVTAFFDELSKTLKQYDTSLAKNLIDYSKLLSAFNTTETKLISSLLVLTQHDDSSLQEKKKQISEAIKRINRRIIVFIDDLDRLEANEILEMMKLIRNVSDFPYMYIIAAYEKSYLVKCLNSKMKLGTTNFIEKIFEHEHILAPCSNESLRRALADQLRKINLSSELEEYIMDHNNKALDALSNLREIYRLSNNITSTKSLLKNERINAIDLLLLGLFKTKYPVPFSLFEHKWHEILVKEGRGMNQYFKLYQGKQEEGYFDFIIYLDNHQVEMCLNEFDIKTIKMILSELFMHQEHDNDDSPRINSVRWFNRYLNLTQLKYDITEKEFNEVMNKTFEEIKRTFDDWSIDKSVSLKHRLMNYDKSQQLNRKQLEKNIHAIFYASIKNLWNSYNELNEIISHLKRFNNKYSDVDQRLIMDELENNRDSIFIHNYIGYLYKENKIAETPLNNDQLIDVQQNIFKDCCKNKNMHYVLLCFSNLLGKSSLDSLINSNDLLRYKNEYKQKLFEAMKKHAEDNIKEFLYYITEIYHGRIGFYKFVGLLWGSWNEFSAFLLTVKDSDPLIVELKDSMSNKKERIVDQCLVFISKFLSKKMFI